MPDVPPQVQISRECETALDEFGDTFAGSGYTKSQAEAEAIYQVMLDIIRPTDGRLSVLDFGCGAGHMKSYVDSQPNLAHIDYSGLDISQRYLKLARTNHPDTTFHDTDVLDPTGAELPVFDYVLMNGVFNYRGEVDAVSMLDYWERLLPKAFEHCRHGLAFNVMSKLVDWEREDLFHLPFGHMTEFVATRLTRHFLIRHDYGAFEYTTYLFRESSEQAPLRGSSLTIEREPRIEPRPTEPTP